MSRIIALEEFLFIDNNAPVLNLLSNKLTNIYGELITNKDALNKIKSGQITKELLDKCVNDFPHQYKSVCNIINKGFPLFINKR